MVGGHPVRSHAERGNENATVAAPVPSPLSLLMLRLPDAFSRRNPGAVGADRRSADQLRTSRRTTGHGRCRGRRDRKAPSPGRRGRHRRGQELRLSRAGHPGHGEKRETGEDDEETAFPRVVISTHTISLQEQLLTKDIPLLRSVMPTEFTAVLVKGRRNYLSLRRMKNAMGRAAGLVQRGRGVRAAPPDRGLVARHARRLAGRSPLQAVARRCGTKWPATAPTAWAASAPPTPHASTTRPGGG